MLDMSPIILLKLNTLPQLSNLAKTRDIIITAFSI